MCGQLHGILSNCCTGPVLKFTQNIVSHVRTHSEPFASTVHVNSCHLGQVVASEPRGLEFESCGIPAEAQEEGFLLNDRTNTTPLIDETRCRPMKLNRT